MKINTVLKSKIEKLKKALKQNMDGKIMIRNDSSFAGDDRRGIHTFNLYFDIPTPRNKDLINSEIVKMGFNPLGIRIVGGSYGYVITFKTKKEIQGEYVNDALQMYYEQQFQRAKNILNRDDQRAHEFATSMVDMYGHRYEEA